MTADEAASAGTNPELRPRLEDEMADVLINLVSLATALDIDLVAVGLAKVDRNEQRFPLEVQP